MLHGGPVRMITLCQSWRYPPSQWLWIWLLLTGDSRRLIYRKKLLLLEVFEAKHNFLCTRWRILGWLGEQLLLECVEAWLANLPQILLLVGGDWVGELLGCSCWKVSKPGLPCTSPSPCRCHVLLGYLEELLLPAGVECLQQALHSRHLHQAQAVFNTV